MPTYVYQCETCGQFEQRQSFSDPALTTCPTCGRPVRKVYVPAPIVFKGSGWYSTDSRGGASRTVDGGKNGGEKKAEEKTEAKSETTGEAKTEAKSDTTTPKSES